MSKGHARKIKTTGTLASSSLQKIKAASSRFYFEAIVTKIVTQ
jgi:hypothetical protein